MGAMLGTVQLLVAKVAGTHLQWATLAWIGGAVVAAAVIITAIVLVSRRPKSMEDGIAEFARSLQAVAPNHRPVGRPVAAQPRPGSGALQEQSPVRRGETGPV